MKNKKEFFGVLISVLASVFLVFLAVYATTSVGSDISVEDDLVVEGLASVSETLRVPTIYGDTDAGQYLRIGDEALTSHSLNATGDLLITGELEVDGMAYFDGAASISVGDFSVEAGNFSVDGTASASGAFQIGGGSNLFGGTASPTGGTHSCAIGDVYFRGGSGTSSTTIYFCEAANSWQAGAL